MIWIPVGFILVCLWGVLAIVGYGVLSEIRAPRPWPQRSRHLDGPAVAMIVVWVGGLMVVGTFTAVLIGGVR